LTVQEISKIYEDNVDEMYRYYYFHLSRKEEAEDLTSTLFHKFIANIEKYDATKSQPKTWLYAMARNILIDYFRNKHTKRKKDELNLDDDKDFERIEAIGDGNKTLEENVQIDRNSRLLRGVVAQLKPDQQELIFLRYTEELAYEEIAERLNIKVNDVGVKLHRTVAKLKKMLEKSDIKDKFDL